MEMSGSGGSKTPLPVPATSHIDLEVLDLRTSTVSDQIINHIKFEHKIEQSLKQSQKDIHQKRLQSLRKELEYINSTAWQFENNGTF